MFASPCLSHRDKYHLSFHVDAYIRILLYVAFWIRGRFVNLPSFKLVSIMIVGHWNAVKWEWRVASLDSFLKLITSFFSWQSGISERDNVICFVSVTVEIHWRDKFHLLPQRRCLLEQLLAEVWRWSASQERIALTIPALQLTFAYTALLCEFWVSWCCG